MNVFFGREKRENKSNLRPYNKKGQDVVYLHAEFSNDLVEYGKSLSQRVVIVLIVWLLGRVVLLIGEDNCIRSKKSAKFKLSKESTLCLTAVFGQPITCSSFTKITSSSPSISSSSCPSTLEGLLQRATYLGPTAHIE